MKLQTALPIAQRIQSLLAPHCIKCEIAGSIRRQKDDVKDIEIVCIPKTHGKSIRRISSWHTSVFNLGKILSGKLKQGKHIKIRLPENIKLDLFVAKPDNYGFIKLIRTGSSEFSKGVMIEFNKLGYTSENGYIKPQNALELGISPENFIFEEEQDVFDFLDLPYIQPVDRKSMRELIISKNKAKQNAKG